MATLAPLPFSTVAGALGTSELKTYLGGVVAHLAIQLNYRLQHPGHVIVCERSLWVGDVASSTISRFLDYADRGIDLAAKVQKALKSQGAKKAAGLNFAGDLELLELFVYVLDESTAGWRGARKRFDLIDVTELSAYEVKSNNPDERKKGVAYIVERLKAFVSLGKLVFADVDQSKWLLRPGLWQPTPQYLPTGLRSAIMQRLAEPGLIAYTQLGDDRDDTLKQLKKDARALRDKFRRIGEPRHAIDPFFVMLAVAVALVAAAGLGVLAAEGAAVAAGLGLRLALAEGATLVGTFAAVTPRLAAGATPASLALPPSDPATADAQAIDAQLRRMPRRVEPIAAALRSVDEVLPGGVGPTEEERAREGASDFARLVVDQVLAIAPRPFPQPGDEMPGPPERIRQALAEWFAEVIASGGGFPALNQLLGMQASPPATPEGAYEVARRMVAFAFPTGREEHAIQYWRSLLTMEDDEIPWMLPESAGASGESSEISPPQGSR